MVQAVLEDISELGGCVQIEEPIALGSSVTLSIGGAEYSGHVCYCVFRDYGYFVGLRFSKDSVWTVDDVAPQHLTDPEALMHGCGSRSGRILN
jgi:hypothetical protein